MNSQIVCRGSERQGKEVMIGRVGFGRKVMDFGGESILKMRRQDELWCSVRKKGQIGTNAKPAKGSCQDSQSYFFNQKEKTIENFQQEYLQSEIYQEQQQIEHKQTPSSLIEPRTSAKPTKIQITPQLRETLRASQAVKKRWNDSRLQEQRQVAMIFINEGFGTVIYRRFTTESIEGRQYISRLHRVLWLASSHLCLLLSQALSKEVRLDDPMNYKKALLVRCRDWMTPAQCETLFKLIQIAYDDSYPDDIILTQQQLISLYNRLAQQILIKSRMMVKKESAAQLSRQKNFEAWQKPGDKDQEGKRVPTSYLFYQKEVIDLFIAHRDVENVLEKVAENHPKVLFRIQNIKDILNTAMMKGIKKTMHINKKNKNSFVFSVSSQEIDQIIARLSSITMVMICKVYLSRQHSEATATNIIRNIRHIRNKMKKERGKADE